jgi:hypothetical protein
LLQTIGAFGRDDTRGWNHGTHSARRSLYPALSAWLAQSPILK